MTLIDDTTLAAARATLEQLHGTSAEHRRLVSTIESSGAETKSWPTITGTISCRVETDMGDTKQAQVRGGAPADRPAYEFTVFAAHDADVRTGDRLILASGIILSVEQASRGQSQAFVQVLYCSEVAA